MGTVALRLILIACIACMAALAQPDELRFRRIGIDQGLSQSTVTDILQDHQGFMWFGTQDGLNRYDGYSFTIFRNEPKDSTSLSDNFIWTIAEDHEGNLWVGTLNDGLNCYREDQGRFVHFTHHAGDSTSLRNNNVTSLCVDREGSVWVGTWGGGLQRYDRTRAAFVAYPSVDPQIRKIIQDRRGMLWIGTWDGLFSLDPVSLQVEHIQPPVKSTVGIAPDRIVSLSEDGDGSILLGTLENGLGRYNPENKRFSRFVHDELDPASISGNSILGVCSDRRGSVWCASVDAGLCRLDTGSGVFHQVRADPAEPTALNSNRLNSLYVDATGALWVGSADAGVCRVDPKGGGFHHIKYKPGEDGGIGHRVVRSLLWGETGKLFVGTAGGGLDLLTKGVPQTRHIRHRPKDPASLGSDVVLALLVDRESTLWAGTDLGGLDRYDASKETFTHYKNNPRDPKSIGSNLISTLFEDHRGTLWIGTTEGGLNRFDRASGTFERFMPEKGNPLSLSGSSVWAISESKSGVFWIGTWGAGLNRFDPAAKTFKHYQHEPENPRSLGNNTIWSIYEDEEGILWLGTWGGGLIRFDPVKEEFSSFTTMEGLPNNVVYGVLPDVHGNLWLSTNNGLARFNPRTHGCRNYDVADGLQSNEFNQGAYCRGGDGWLYFGGINGITAFNPDSLRDDLHPPPVVLTEFKVMYNPVRLPRRSGSRGDIRLSYKENFFSFEFAALSFAAPAKNQYAYRLEGLENEWVYCGVRRFVNYTDLGAGTYIFRVKGSNSDGVWNEEGTSVIVHIAPPYWKTWWFSLLVTALLCAGIFAAYRYRVEKLLDVERLRTRIGSDLHDDIGSGLTRIAVLSDVASQQAREFLQGSGATNPATDPGATKFSVDASIQKIGHIARELVDAMSDVVWSIDPAHDSLPDLVQRIKSYAFELCEARNITLTFEVEAGLERARLTPEVMRSLLLIAKEAVTNIVRHSGASAAKISIANDRKNLHLRVEDNGRGFAPGSVKGGHGLGSMRARTKRAGGSFALSSSPGRTQIEAILPLS